MDDSQDERKILYDRFRQDVSLSSFPEYYDENDLIEIFDYAGDVDDDFVRLEVLLHGARLFPDSDGLAIRRGYFYYSISNDDGAAITVQKVGSASALRDILALRVAAPDADETCRVLADIVERTEDFDDEAVIQLVDVASALDVYEWLKKNMDYIRSKCSYPQTLLYELSVVAEIRSDFVYAAKMIEQLTMLEPFNVSYWVMLAQEYINYGNYDGALNAVDYALAIDPTSFKALETKAQIMYFSRKDVLETEALLKQIIAGNQDNSYAVRLLVALYMENSREKDAKDLLAEYNSEHPDDRMALDYMLMLGMGQCKELILKYYNTEREHSEEGWTDWARSHAAEHRNSVAALILDFYDKNVGIETVATRSFYYEQLYISREFEKVILLYDQEIDNNGGYTLTGEMILMAVLSCMRTGNPTKAYAESCRMIEKYKNTSLTASQCIFEKGLMTVLLTVKAVVEQGLDMPVDDYDPFVQMS